MGIIISWIEEGEVHVKGFNDFEPTNPNIHYYKYKGVQGRKNHNHAEAQLL